MATYLIKSGDTLSQIAQKQKTTVADLLKSNPSIKDPNMIMAGSSLNLPSGTTASQWIQDPNNPNASVKNPNYVAPVAPVATAPNPTTPPATPPVAPLPPDPNEQAKDALNQQLMAYQDSLASQTEPEIPVRESTQLLKQAIGAEAPVAPTAPNLAAEYGTLRGEQGVEPLEQTLTSLDAKIQEIEQIYREKTGEERDISLAFRSSTNKKLYEETQQQLDIINREKNTVVSQLNNKLNTINQLMQFKQQDYQTSYQEYNDKFNRQLKLIDTLSGIEEREIEAEDKVTNNAKANLGVMTDMISEALKAGSIASYDGLSASVKLNIQKLEMQAGLPAGFSAQVLAAVNPEKEVLQQIVWPDKTNVTILYKDGTSEILRTGIPAEVATEIVTPAGQTQPITTLSGKPLTDTQATSLGYAQRMNDANQIINDLGNKMTSWIGTISGSKFFPNILKSDDRQMYEQAERNFVNAVLRKESGAAISPSEFDSAAKQYFPQSGDSKAVVEQKATNRQRVIANLTQAANVSLQTVIGTQNVQSGGSYENYLNAIK